ncbi:MAG: thioesterase [Brevibacillus sp.]|nr:thioesterase [Brevibacillus sp.]
MKAGLQPGVTAGVTVTVTEDMRPIFDGKVVHHVMSTVSMIYYMEKAGRQVILPFLEEDEEGAGFGIDIKHVGPAVIGQEVRFKAICTEVTHKRVVCDVFAETDFNLVGKGSFTQVIFNKTEIMQRFAELQQKVDEQSRK